MRRIKLNEYQNGTFIATYPSIADACRARGFVRPRLCRCIWNNKPYHGFTYQIADEIELSYFRISMTTKMKKDKALWRKAYLKRKAKAKEVGL